MVSPLFHVLVTVAKEPLEEVLEYAEQRPSMPALLFSLRQFRVAHLFPPIMANS